MGTQITTREQVLEKDEAIVEGLAEFLRHIQLIISIALTAWLLLLYYHFKVLILKMVSHIVKVNRDGFLFKKFDALYTNLSVLCLMILLILLLFLHHLLLIIALLGLRPDSWAINAASLMRFIDLRGDNFVQPNISFLSVGLLVKIYKLLNLILNCNLHRVKQS